MNKDIHRLLRDAAKAALSEWYPGQHNLQRQELEDLIHELWVWFLESPSVAGKLGESDPRLAKRLAFNKAMQTLAGNALQADTFNGRTLFSSESVKDALKGRSTNKYLLAVLPIALSAVQHKDDQTPGREYAEALRKRYEDEQIPSTKHEENKLVYAHKAITDEVNVHYLTSDVSGIGSSNIVFPGIRRRVGGHSDPTAGTALTLLDAAEDDPDVLEAYLTPTSWEQVMHGAAAEPTYPLPFGARVRPTGWIAALLLEVPALVDVYIKVWREQAA